MTEHQTRVVCLLHCPAVGLEELRVCSHLQAFELQGVIARATLLRLLQSRIGLVPLPDDRQVTLFHAAWPQLEPRLRSELLLLLLLRM